MAGIINKCRCLINVFGIIVASTLLLMNTSARNIRQHKRAMDLLDTNICQSVCEYCLYCCANIYSLDMCEREDYTAFYRPRPLSKRLETGLENGNIVDDEDMGDFEHEIMRQASRSHKCQQHCSVKFSVLCQCKAHFERMGHRK